LKLVEQLCLIAGGLLIVFGVMLGVWVVNLVRTAMFEPETIPLLEFVVDRIDDGADVHLEKEGDELTVRGSRSVFQLILVGSLFLAVGGIVHAALSGGVALVGIGLGRRPKEGKRAS
jgi:hypothetical protein